MKKIRDASPAAPPSPIAGRWFVVLACLGAAVFVASLRGLNPDASVEAARSSTRESRSVGSRATEPATSAPAPTSLALQADESLTVYVARKYAPLIEGSFQPTALTDAFYDALHERERLAVMLNTSRQSLDPTMRSRRTELEAALAGNDERIRSLLHPTDYAAFEVLKDADVELFQLDDYADGIANVAPLDESARRAVLLTKLKHKRQFRGALLDSGILRNDLSPAARRAAFASVRREFEQYTQGYLQEIRQYLHDDAQYALLKNYETTEFAAELDKLRAIAYDE